MISEWVILTEECSTHGFDKQFPVLCVAVGPVICVVLKLPILKKIQINRIVQSKCNINDTFPMYCFLSFFFGCTCYCLVICFTFEIVCKLSSSYTHYFLYMYIQIYENEDCGKCN